MIVMIDNYDSFTYNIVQYLEMLGKEVKTFRNNKTTLEAIAKLKPSQIIISPGPGTPKDAGISIEVIKKFAGKVPILGVCLGHQAIIEAFGGKIIQAQRIVHGKKEPMAHDERGLFRNIPNNFQAVRYHSLAGDRNTLPQCLEITAASTVDNEIMGIRHTKYQIEGIQFHPESIGTEHGLRILKNFIEYNREQPQKIPLLKKLTENCDLAGKEASQLMDEITSGDLTESQLGACLGALSVKGVTADELSSFAQVLRDKTGITKRVSGSLDTCGTGGDGKHTFNISTSAALVCASLGIPVAKHGNRAITSKSGSFDFLNALGIKTDGDLAYNLASLKKNNFAFFFAPLYHSAMKYVAKVRQEIKVRTVFNMIGPLINPLQADYQVIGIFDQKLMDVYIQALKILGLKRALVVHGKDGIDEISICAPTFVKELNKNGKISSYIIKPADFAIKGYKEKDIVGGTAADNVELFKEIASNNLKTKKHKAVQEAISINAGAALFIAGKAKTIVQGYKLAKEQMTSGKLAKYLGSIA